MSGRGNNKGAKPPYLREWRTHAGLTLEQAAERVGASDKTWLSKRENRRTPTTTDDLDKLAAVYRCAARDFYGYPPAGVNDQLGIGNYGSVSEAEDASIREGMEMPKTHAELAMLVMDLPPDTIQTVGMFIKKLIAAQGGSPARPHKGEAGA